MNDVTADPTVGTPEGHGTVTAAPAGYAILDEVGRGGMGVVYRARDLALDRAVAVKCLQDKYTANSPTAGRFLDEARITAQLQHPGIPAVYQVGTLPDGRPFLAMKLIRGQTLDTLLKADAAVDVLAVFEAVAQAVGYAHAHGVIHRDLKPANVMVGSFGEVQVMDWGLAKVLGQRVEVDGHPTGDPEATVGQTAIRSQRDSETPFTQYGSVLGTPAYMAPEQAAGELDKVDCRSDVFALGAILCRLLTGEPPYTGKDADAVRIAAMRGNTAEALARIDSCGAEPDVIALCQRCLAFEPSARPATANEVAAAVGALRQAADERARQAERDRMAAEVQAAEQAKRRRLTAVAAVAVAAVLLLGIGGTTWGLLDANEARALAEQRQQEAETESAAKEKARQQAETESAEKEKARQAAETARNQAIEAQQVAEQKRKEAEAAREVTSQQRRLALDTVRDVLIGVDGMMQNDRRFAALRLRIIRQALNDVDKIRDHALKNPLEDRTETLAYSRIGDIYFKANRIEDAAFWLNKAYAQSHKLATAAPDDPIALASAAYAANLYAEAEWRLGNGARARELYTLALERRRKRLELIGKTATEMEVASAKLDLAQALNNLAFTELRMGEAATAIETYLAADQAYAALPPPLPNFLMVRRTCNEIQFRLGEAKARLGRLDEAEKHYRQALANREALLLNAARGPTATLLRTDVGQSRMGLGDMLLMYRKDRTAAGAEYAICRELFAAGLKEEPDSLDIVQRQGATYYRLGLAATDPAKASEAYGECLKIRQELAKIDLRDMESRVQLALAEARAGHRADAERTANAILRLAGKDRQVLLQVACTFAVLSGVAVEVADADRYRDEAFRILRALVQAGWHDRGGVESDPDFDAIRDHPRFRELLKTLR